MEITLRNETASDYRRVEHVTREAFWNLYVPGCSEHYMAHVIRNHPDFIPDLDYVACIDNQIVGNIMYTKSWVVDETGKTVETLSFGPVSVLPEYQRKGIGSALIQHTVSIARARGYPAIIIFGSPSNYCKHGFKSCRDYNLTTTEGRYPYGMLVLELQEGFFKNHSWKFHESAAFNVEPEQVEAFDRQFEPKEKGYRYTQDEFKIECRAYVA